MSAGLWIPSPDSLRSLTPVLNMEVNKIHYDMTKLYAMLGALEKVKGEKVQVGIFANKDTRTDVEGNAEIGAKMEFGFTITEGTFAGRKVPARSFLRYPIATLFSNIKEKAVKDFIQLFYANKVDLALKRLGIMAEKAVDYAFQTRGMGQWAPNTPVTIILKGHDRVLEDTLQLRHSIVSRVVKK